MKIILDTTDPDREAFMEKATELAKKMHFYGTTKQPLASKKPSDLLTSKRPGEQLTSKKAGGPLTPKKQQISNPPNLGPLNVNQILRIEIMMQNLPGVVCALELGADLDYTQDDISTRELGAVYQHKEIQEAIKDYDLRKPAVKKKMKPSPHNPKS